MRRGLPLTPAPTKFCGCATASSVSTVACGTTCPGGRWRGLTPTFSSSLIHYAIQLSGGPCNLHSQCAIHGETAMKRSKILRDESGTTALEFALTAPAFFCSSSASSKPVCCSGRRQVYSMAPKWRRDVPVLIARSVRDPTAITSYATQHSFGLTLPTSTFTYSTPACGNQVDANYAFQWPSIFGLKPLNLTAKACFPT